MRGARQHREGKGTREREAAAALLCYEPPGQKGKTEQKEQRVTVSGRTLARGVAKNGEDVSRGGGLDSIKQWAVQSEIQQASHA